MVRITVMASFGAETDNAEKGNDYNNTKQVFILGSC